MAEIAFEGTWYATYAIGPIALAYQQSYVDRNVAGGAATAATTSTKAVGTATGSI